PGRFVEFVDRTPLLAGGKPVLDVGDGPCLALAGGVVVGKPSERQVEVAVAPADPTVDQAASRSRSGRIDQVDGDISNEVRLREVRSETDTELVGTHAGVAEVLGGDLAELVVVDGEDAVGGVEIV